MTISSLHRIMKYKKYVGQIHKTITKKEKNVKVNRFIERNTGQISFIISLVSWGKEERIIFFRNVKLKNNNFFLTLLQLFFNIWEGQNIVYPAGLTSLEDYFQKGVFLGQKAALNLCYVDARPNSQKMFLSIWRSVIFG